VPRPRLNRTHYDDKVMPTTSVRHTDQCRLHPANHARRSAADPPPGLDSESDSRRLSTPALSDTAPRFPFSDSSCAVDHYPIQVVITESCEPSSPSIRGLFGHPNRSALAANATDVQHPHRRRHPSGRPREPLMRERAIGRGRATHGNRKPNRLELVLHVCCTRAVLLGFSDRLAPLRMPRCQARRTDGTVPTPWRRQAGVPLSWCRWSGTLCQRCR
jgi:hypothetical protein